MSSPTQCYLCFFQNVDGPLVTAAFRIRPSELTKYLSYSSRADKSISITAPKQEAPLLFIITDYSWHVNGVCQDQVYTYYRLLHFIVGSQIIWQTEVSGYFTFISSKCLVCLLWFVKNIFFWNYFFIIPDNKIIIIIITGRFHSWVIPVTRINK